MLRTLSTDPSARSGWAAKKNHCCFLRNRSWHAAAGMGGYRLDVFCATKGWTHRGLV